MSDVVIVVCVMRIFTSHSCFGTATVCLVLLYGMICSYVCQFGALARQACCQSLAMLASHTHCLCVVVRMLMLASHTHCLCVAERMRVLVLIIYVCLAGVCCFATAYAHIVVLVVLLKAEHTSAMEVGLDGSCV